MIVMNVKNKFESTLKNRSRGYETVFEKKETAVMVIDENMTILRVNDQLEKVSGYRKQDLEQKKQFTEFVHPDYLSRMVMYHKERRNTPDKAPATCECRLIHKDGIIKKYTLHISLIPNTKRSMISFMDTINEPVTHSLKTTEDQMFRLMAENTTDQVFIADLDVNILYISPSVEKISGYTQEEFKLLTPKEYFTPTSYEKAKKKILKGLEGKYDITQPFLTEYEIIHKNGDLKWIETLVQFILDDDGKPFEITGASRDITRKKHAEESLKASEAKYRQLTEGLSDVVLVVLPDFTIDYISPVITELGGYQPEEVTGRIFMDYFALREEYDLAIALLEEIVRSKKPTTNLEFLFKARTRKPFYVEITAKPIVKDNKVVMIQCVARDISERKIADEIRKKRELTLSMENRNLRKSIQQSGRFANIIGRSQAMMDVYDLLLMSAPSNLNTIIYGESGTGKELIARAIHDLSDRSKAPFVPVNCGAISENIIESEFFGYSKGAFTGAVHNKEGFLDLADGGTLFLDEIGEIGLNMQVKLLRAIEGGGYTPVGSNKLKKPDIRIVAATNSDLIELVKNNKMRSDFFFRINIIRIDLPPLRDRKEDIPLLVDHFIGNSKHNTGVTRFPQDVMDFMIGYRWPGNVRELQNVVNQYLALKRIVFSSFGENKEKDTSKDTSGECFIENFSGTLSSMVNEYEKKILCSQLTECGWNKSKVAKKLNIDRKTLDVKIKKYGIENRSEPK